jgi:hypothetical protein
VGTKIIEAVGKLMGQKKCYGRAYVLAAYSYVQLLVIDFG